MQLEVAVDDAWGEDLRVAAGRRLAEVVSGVRGIA